MRAAGLINTHWSRHGCPPGLGPHHSSVLFDWSWPPALTGPPTRVPRLPSEISVSPGSVSSGTVCVSCKYVFLPLSVLVRRPPPSPSFDIQTVLESFNNCSPCPAACGGWSPCQSELTPPWWTCAPSLFQGGCFPLLVAEGRCISKCAEENPTFPLSLLIILHKIDKYNSSYSYVCNDHDHLWSYCVF